MAQSGRPLSPHLQVYKWELHMLLSILHRATGVALGAGMVALSAWIIAAATSAECFATVNDFLSGWFGRTILFGFTLSLMMHLAHGIRHLIWDAGSGYDIHKGRTWNLIEVLAAFALTGLVWAIGYGLV